MCYLSFYTAVECQRDAVPGRDAVYFEVTAFRMHLPPPLSRQISSTEDEGRKFLLNVRVLPNFTALYSITSCWAVSVEFLVVSSVVSCCVLCPTGMFVYRLLSALGRCSDV